MFKREHLVVKVARLKHNPSIKSDTKNISTLKFVWLASLLCFSLSVSQYIVHFTLEFGPPLENNFRIFAWPDIQIESKEQ